MIEFDKIDEWAPQLSAALAGIVSESVRNSISTSRLEYIEDARKLLLDLAPRNKVIDATLEWLGRSTIKAFHGSKLTKDDISSIRNTGLLPLNASSRKDRLARALSKHPNWATVEHRLDSVIATYGAGGKAGMREGQVHLTLSRSALLHSFNHYIRYGSEFDQHVAFNILGNDGYEMLEQDGDSVLVHVDLQGQYALEGAHPIFSVDDVLRRGEIPNLVKEFLTAWSFQLHDVNYKTEGRRIDCGIWFRRKVPPECISDITLYSQELGEAG